MEPAQYFIVKDLDNEQWHHYALNFEVYTHFTSPIRRYFDVIIHTATVGGSRLKEEDETVSFYNLIMFYNLSEKKNNLIN